MFRYIYILCYLPETRKGDDGFIKSPRGNKVFPDWIGGIISPGRLEINSDRRTDDGYFIHLDPHQNHSWTLFLASGSVSPE